MRMNRPHPLSLLVLISCLSVAACATNPPPTPGASSPPGGEILVQVGRAATKDAASLRATVGSRPARVRVVGEKLVAVRVPGLEPGVADVVVAVGDREFKRATVTVRDTPARALVLYTDGKSFRLRAVRRSPDAFTGNVRSSMPRLSFDVIGQNGAAVYSASIISPIASGGEYFSIEGAAPRVNIGRAAPPTATEFSIRIPTPPPGTVVRIYAVPAGLDIGTEEGRNQRSLLQEVVLP
jgi:hypothetical protein